MGLREPRALGSPEEDQLFLTCCSTAHSGSAGAGVGMKHRRQTRVSLPDLSSVVRMHDPLWGSGCGFYLVLEIDLWPFLRCLWHVPTTDGAALCQAPRSMDSHIGEPTPLCCGSCCSSGRVSILSEFNRPLCLVLFAVFLKLTLEKGGCLSSLL